MLQQLKKFFDEKGQGLVEYALLLAFVVAIGVAIFSSGSGDDPATGLKPAVESKFKAAEDALKAQD